jgi:hypothetical protein
MAVKPPVFSLCESNLNQPSPPCPLKGLERGRDIPPLDVASSTPARILRARAQASTKRAGSPSRTELEVPWGRTHPACESSITKLDGLLGGARCRLGSKRSLRDISFQFTSAGEAIAAPAVEYSINEMIRNRVIAGDEAVTLLAFQDLKFRRSDFGHVCFFCGSFNMTPARLIPSNRPNILLAAVETTPAAAISSEKFRDLRSDLKGL